MAVIVSVLEQQIAKARQRAKGLDLATLSATDPALPPRDMASRGAQADRRDLLTQTLGPSQGADVFERLIAGNELQPINYLAHGVVAARPVCRITINDQSGRCVGYASGFLIAPCVLLTNHHVFPDPGAAAQSIAEFDYELDVFDQPRPPCRFSLRPDRMFYTSDKLDYSVVAVEETGDGGIPLANYGFLPLIDSPGKAVEGEWLTIVQHPDGERKQVCVRENKLLTRTDDVLWYSTDTLAGSSGSPVYNNDWQVVALHHSGVPDTRNGVMQTVDGRDFDPRSDDESQIKWIANEGIRISRLVGDLRQQAPTVPMLQPVFNMTPDQANAIISSFARQSVLPAAEMSSTPRSTLPTSVVSPARKTAMASRSVTITLDISDDGRVSLRAPGAGAQEAFFNEAARAPATPKPKATPSQYAVPFDPDYKSTGRRKGYDEAYLGAALAIALPDLGSLATEVTKRIDGDTGRRNDFILDYFDYSVAMHAQRKFAIYTAANVDGAGRFHVKHPHDEWRFDPRIPQNTQIGSYYYANNNFDKGHLTRYEDMQYGTDPVNALERAQDTLMWANCTPQQAKFNETQVYWQGLEQDILEQSIEARQFKAVMFTGPVLDPGDPVWDKYKDVQYPVKFWKIAVAPIKQDDQTDTLFAAGFVLDQTEAIDKYGIESTEEVPFAPFKTYQVAIAEIERLTGLTFNMVDGRSLSNFDPMASGTVGARRAQSRVKLTESTLAGTATPYGYVPVQDGTDIIR